MDKKSVVVSSVIKEIDSLVDYYEIELEKKENEIERLTDIMDSMRMKIFTEEANNERLRAEMNNLAIKKHDNPNNLQEIFFSFAASDYVKLEEYLVNQESWDMAILLLEYFIYAVEEEKFDITEDVLIDLLNHVELFGYQHERLEKSLRLVFECVFKDDDRFTNGDYDETLISTLEFMIKLERTPNFLVVTKFIRDYFDTLLDNILHTNYLDIIIPFLRLCYKCDSHDLLKKALHKIIKNDWEYLDSGIRGSQLYTVFWYSYLTEMDTSLLKVMGSRETINLRKQKEYELYFYVSDCLEERLLPDEQVYINYKEAFSTNDGLTSTEKDAVILKSDYRFNKLINSNKQFKWPSTEIKEDSTSEVEFELKQESELKSFGYQITGLSRVKRWEVLEEAVPALGLYKVAYTIANHVRMRKGQSNGEIKFKHAISQWEYDLDRLKSVYYKGNFNWPSTQIKRS